MRDRIDKGIRIGARGDLSRRISGPVPRLVADSRASRTMDIHGVTLNLDDSKGRCQRHRGYFSLGALDKTILQRFAEV